jgi:glycosyltransferase involved in cell wall biosynthesis
VTIKSSHRGTPRILVDARFAAAPRGGDRCRYELALNLIRQGSAQYTFLAYAHAAALLAPSPFPFVTTPWHPSQHPGADCYEHVLLPLIGRRLKTDIYHGTFQVLPLLRPARATVLTVHDMAVFAHPQAYGTRFAVYMRRLLGAGIKSADRIITVSEATKQELVRYFPDAEAKTVSILNGVGKAFQDAVTLPTDLIMEARARFSLTEPYILFVGNLEPKKNLPRLIEAFKRLRAATRITQNLVIVGKPLAEGPGSGIAAEDLQHGSIRFTGYVEDKDLPLLYRGADLVAYPSLYEGFGMPVLEGMAAGVPVLTSSISSLPEVAGGAALLIDPFDCEAIAAGLHRALTDKAWRLYAADAGMRRASSLTWAENARQTAALYSHLHETTQHHL